MISNPYRQVHACVVPHNVHIHSQTISLDDIVATQPQIQLIPTIESLRGKTSPIVSIVKGMSFSLVDLTDAPEVMAALRPGESPAAKLDEEWNVGLVGCLYYARQGVEEGEGQITIHRIHQRMMVQGLEDPGTGSASCALGCYLALTMTEYRSGQPKGQGEKTSASQENLDITEGTKTLSLGDKKEHYAFGFEQGVEMGRKCQMCVEVDITVDEEGGREVSMVMMSGRSTFVTKGEILDLY